MKGNATTKQSKNINQSPDREKPVQIDQELDQKQNTPVLQKASQEAIPNQNNYNMKENKKKSKSTMNYELTDSSNQITNDRDNNNPISFKIQKIKNLNNNTLSADTYTYNESGEEITSLSNSFECGNLAFLNLQKEKADQFVTFFDELSKIQTEDFKDISNQRSLLLEKVQMLLNVVENYETIIKQEQEKRLIIESKNNQAQEQSSEFQSQNDFIRQEIEALLRDKLNESTDDQFDDDFYSFILNSFQKVINEYEQKIKKEYVQKNKYEILLQQLEQSIQLLSGISNMNDESSKKTYILTQCARIGHFIDEQMNNNCIENLPNENSFCQFDPKALIETFFEKISDNQSFGFTEEEEENEEENHNDICEKSPYKEIMLFFVGINKINELISNKNQDLIKENVELKNLISNQDLQIRDYEEWKQKQLENISLIEDTLGYQNSNSEFSINEVNAELMKYPPEEAIKNLIQVYNDALAENKILADDIRRLKKPQEMEETFDSIKTQFISLERDFTKEKVKFDETVKELVLSIQEKDKTISEDKNIISQLIEKKKKYKEEVKKSYSEINTYQSQISELENQIKTMKEENDNFKEKSANFENEKNQHQIQLDEIIDEMKNKEKKYKKKILKFKKQLFEFEKYQEENEIKCTKIIESNKKNIQHLKDQIESRNKEISSLKNNLNDFLVKIKEFQTNEQILNSKINLMKKKEEAISTEKELIKKNSSEKVEFISKKIESMTNSLLSLMKNIFEYEPQKFDVSFETLLSIFSDILTKNKSQFNDVKIKCDQLNNALLNLKSENQLLKKEVDKINSFKKPKISFEPINPLSSSSSSESNKWETWAKSLCNRICHYNLSNPNDLRFAIEETMMCSIGYKNVFQKLEFLRAEKKICLLLMKQERNVTFNPQNRPLKSSSIRSIMMMVIFCGRIRKIAGAKAIESIISSSFSVGRSPNQTKSFNDNSIFTKSALQ